eukprot:TRINITY_DN3418_c0_g1_i1.p1 TRINITY_DN3418_c0_g1~~TRINITY_DN3418_c0_g1_i1.p1  ORF type:complete len:828 (+),score=282.26 TRINITY_DN3418_c0_g1_i1:29-2512(+)
MSKKQFPTDLHKQSQKDWKAMIGFYESKAYDKAVKSADLILKRTPNQIETICIKALSLIQVDIKKKEAYDIIKLALKTNLKNPKLWRTLGQLHSYDGQFEQAVNAFKTSLRMEAKQPEVIKELAELQIYLRDYTGYNESRASMFNDNSSTMSNWMGYATSSYLAGDIDLALNIISTFIDNGLLVSKSVKPPSRNKIVCFKLRLLEESGKDQEFLTFLKKHEIFLTDKAYINELLFRVYTRLGQKEKAKEAITYLLERSTENSDYHNKYLLVNGLLNKDGAVEEENIPKVLQIYSDLKKKYPRSFSISRIPLTYAKGDSFKTLFSEFIQPNLVKGVPSLFNSVKSLYKDQEKVQIITQIITEILESITKNNTFPNDEEKLPITTILWVWIYCARHYDMVKDYKKAFELIDKAIEHTPTLEDLYFIKAKFAKHVGDFQTAYRLVDKAKNIDIGDRFMNTKATVYAFRSGNFEAAEKTASHFAKEQGQINLSSMQAHWFFKEAGLCCFHKKDYTKALEMFKIATKHYTDYRNDEFDMHTFNYRICSLTSEVDMVKSTDSYFKHPDYFISATKIVEIYLLLLDQPKIEITSEKIEGEKDKVTPPPEDYFAEAVKLTQLLQKNNPHKLETHLLAFEINFRRKKFLLALKALKHAYSIAPEDPRVNFLKVKYFSQIFSNNLNETLTKVIKAESLEKSGLGGDFTVQLFVDKLPTDTTAQRLAVARSLLILDKNSNLERVSKLFLSDENPTGLVSSVEAFHFLEELGLKEVALKFKTSSAKSFPFSSFFGDQKIAMVQEDIHDTAYDEYEKSKESKQEGETTQPTNEESKEESK